LSEINSNVSDTVNFDTAMETFLKENKQYLANDNEPSKTIFKSSSTQLDNGAGEKKNTNQKMNALFRGARN
jgi:hypothetical protein